MAEDTPKAPAPEAPAKKGKKPSEMLAYRLWLESGRPSLRDLEKILATKGYSVDNSTLCRWKDKNPQWIAQMADKDAAVDPVKVISALKEAEDDATELAPEHFIGVKAQLVARLYKTIKAMPIDSVDEWLKALEACDRIEALIHNERGKVVADKDTIATPRGATPSLLARLNPPVKLAEFKKPNGGAA